MMVVNNSDFIVEPSKNNYFNLFIIVQVIVILFLFINFLLILTFCMKDSFHTSMRYILFAVTLLSDSLILLLTDIMVILVNFRLKIQTALCIILFIIASQTNYITTVTLTAMVLERYVAICLPLRHSDLSTTRNMLYLILIINGLSSLPWIIFMSIFFASATQNFYSQDKIYILQLFIMHDWQSHLYSAISQFYFLVICIIIGFCYFKIMKIAKAASGESKKSTWRGLRTVILHAFQLLLCVIQLWCPFIETALFQISYSLFRNIRYFNYITFVLAPRCLSPLIYGLRDEAFLQAFKHHILCGLCKKTKK